jgi:putative membrane fusion protein
MIKQNGSPVSAAGKRRRPKKFFKYLFIVALLLLFIIILSRLFLVSSISKIQFLSSQSVSQTISFDCILIKKEKVIESPASGRLRLMEPDGKRLETGAKAAEIIVADPVFGEVTYDIFTDSAGLLCSHLDGLEGIITPQKPDMSELSGIEKTGEKAIPDGMMVNKGQPVLKIIDNLSPVSIYSVVPRTAFTEAYLGKPVMLQASWENMSFGITPGKLTDKGENIEVFYVLSDYPEMLVHHRTVHLIVTTRVLNGILVPDKAVVYRAGEPGIYLVIKKRVLWTPVEIEGELSGKVAVAGEGLSEGERFVSNPVLIREGWTVE